MNTVSAVGFINDNYLNKGADFSLAGGSPPPVQWIVCPLLLPVPKIHLKLSFSKQIFHFFDIPGM
jgi:hypothetical protein